MRHVYLLRITIFALISASAISFSMADIKFTDISAQAGINDTAKGTSTAFVDYNGDGNLDIYVGNSGKFAEPVGKPNILYHNNGDGTFTDMAVKAGIADERQTQGIAFGDFDNDGDLDLYVVNDFGLNALYRNKGDGTFEDITQAAGVKGGIDIVGGEEIPNGYGVALADENNDGYLDIYVVNLGSSNILYRNNGNGTFMDVTTQAGVKAGIGPQSAGTAAIFSDCDNDGWLDLFAVNGYGMDSFLYINIGQSFDDGTSKAGIGELPDAQGAVFGDYDNDGDLDLYVTNFATAEGAPLPNILYRNDGKGVFEDVTEKAGAGGNDYSLGAAFGDLDNDGYLDLYVVNNGSRNILYRNNGDGTFTDITETAGVGYEGWGSTAVFGDIDNDGYTDIYVANSGHSDEDTGDPDVLYHNNGGNNHWLQIQLVGKSSNCAGIGARIKVSADGLNQMREISGGKGYAQDSLIANFGLGERLSADTVTVLWPSGVVQTLTNVGADQRITIEEGISAPVQPHSRIISVWGKTKGMESGDKISIINSKDFVLGQNYPNPFNPETWIPYQIPRNSRVTITIYSSTGEMVREMVMGHQPAGSYLSREKAAYWDGKNASGEYVSSGVYFYRLRADDFTGMRKMLLLR